MSVSYIPEQQSYKEITPFRRFILQSFPWINETFDALTNYELMGKIIEYLNTIISNENTVQSNVTELYNAFVELYNYFNNLDVQDEINNKLDSMVEDGTLQEIIASYLNANAIWCFDNVEAMKNATNLIDGSFAKTLGFYEKNDGGSALYKIRTMTNDDVIDEMFIIEMNDSENQLIAELIFDNINLKQIGAKGDGETNDSLIIQSSINKAQSLKKNVIAPEGHYIINSTLTLYGRTSLKGDGIVVFDFSNISTENDYCIKIDQSTITYSDSRKSDDLINNITFRGYNTDFTENIPSNYSSKNLFYITTHEFTINNITVYGFNKVFTYGSNSYIISVLNSVLSHNNYCVYYDQTGINNSGERISFLNCTIGNNKVAIHNYLGMLSFIDCSIDYNLKICDLFTSKISGTSSGRSSFVGCHFEDTIQKIPRTENRFEVTNAIIEFTNNEFWFNKLPFITETNNSLSKLSFVNNDFRVTDYENYFLVTNYRASTFKENSFVANTTQLKLSQFENNINQSFNSFVTNTTDGTAAFSNNTLAITSGTYVTGYSQSDYIEIPKTGVSHVWLKFNYQGSDSKSANKSWIFFFADNKTQVSSVPTNFDVTTQSQEKYLNTTIPNNAKYYRIILHSPIPNGTTYYSNVYSDFI